MAKTTDPLAGLQQEICDAWEQWPDRENEEHWLTMNMFRFYSSIGNDYPDLAYKMPAEKGDEIWQRVKYLLLDHERNMGRRD